MNGDRTRLLGSDPIIPSICEGPGEPGLVSVLIPTYNRGYIVGQAIESVLAQTYRPIEIVVVDDGSKDDTREVLERFGQHIRYIYQDNAGLAAARNTGLVAARGEFLAFQDSDDLWVPWKLKAQVALMRRFPDIGLVWTDMTAIDPAGAVLRERYLTTMYHVYQELKIEDLLPHSGWIKDICPDCPSEISDASYRYGDIFDAMFVGNLVHPPTGLMRRTCLRRSGGLDLTFSLTCEDYEFFFRVCREGLGAVIEAPGMLYRVGGEDQLSKPDLHLHIARGNLATLRRRLAKDRDRIKLPQKTVRHRMAKAYGWVAEEELLSDRGKSSIGYFCRSLLLNPRQKRTLLLALFSLLPRPLFRLARSAKQRLGSSR
jgi:glycosyltransferase involved in cell wall biosynthesis